MSSTVRCLNMMLRILMNPVEIMLRTLMNSKVLANDATRHVFTVLTLISVAVLCYSMVFYVLLLWFSIVFYAFLRFSQVVYAFLCFSSGFF